MTTPGDPFIVYSMADGSEIDEFSWVTELEWFDDRDREIRLIKSNYVLVSRELVVLPDPYPPDEEDEAEEVHQGLIETMEEPPWSPPVGE